MTYLSFQLRPNYWSSQLISLFITISIWKSPPYPTAWPKLRETFINVMIDDRLSWPCFVCVSVMWLRSLQIVPHSVCCSTGCSSLKLTNAMLLLQVSQSAQWTAAQLIVLRLVFNQHKKGMTRHYLLIFTGFSCLQLIKSDFRICSQLFKLNHK